MRRKDREMPRDFAEGILDGCEWAVLSMVTPEGKPYCVPLTIVREGAWVYFHAAMQGKKLDCLRENPAVCMACVGYTHRMPDKFTTEFESAILEGKAQEVADEKEKIHALRLLCQRHTPANMGEFDAAIARSLQATAVWKIHIDVLTGKRKRYGPDGRQMKRDAAV